jgi:hypothetical protein
MFILSMSLISKAFEPDSIFGRDNRFWSGWRRCLEIVRPDTVLRWHRRAFTWHWTRKSRRLPGRPEVAANICDLIRRMSQANPLWGVPRTLHNYFTYYQRSRTHLALGKDAPEARAVEPPEQGCVVAIPQVGGLHHRYQRRAA